MDKFIYSSKRVTEPAQIVYTESIVHALGFTAQTRQGIRVKAPFVTERYGQKQKGVSHRANFCTTTLGVFFIPNTTIFNALT